jgi:hypothetical protein
MQHIPLDIVYLGIILSGPGDFAKDVPMRPRETVATGAAP